MSDKEKEYIEFHIFLIGEPYIGKQAFINRFTRIPCTQVIQPEISDLPSVESKTKLVSENDKSKISESDDRTKKFSILDPIDENCISFGERKIVDKKECASILFNVNNFKLCFKCFYIFPCEELQMDSAAVNSEDSDYEYAKNYKISFKKVKAKINDILKSNNLIVKQSRLSSMTKITIENLFIFMFDLTDSKSFDKLTVYYKAISNKFLKNSQMINENENDYEEEESNFNSVIIGNKVDKKILFDSSQQKAFNAFLNENNLNYYEVSTRPYFQFENFFESLFNDIYGGLREDFSTEKFKKEFNLIMKSRPTFPQAKRANLYDSEAENVPGVGTYNLNNLYSITTKKDLEDAFLNKKDRFKKKIFVVKSGPVFQIKKGHNSEFDKTSDEFKRQRNKIFIGKDLKDCYQKIEPGFTFAGSSNKYSLNLKEDRLNKRKVNQKQILSGLEDIPGYSHLIKSSSSINLDDKIKRINDDSYFENAQLRKEVFHEEKLKPFLERHSRNLQKIDEILKDRAKTLAESQKKIVYSPSKTKRTLENFGEVNDDNLREFEKLRKKRFYDVMYSGNREHIQRQVNKKEIDEGREGHPQLYDVRGNLLSKNKGFTMVFKHEKKEDPNEAKGTGYFKFKDDFDELLERNANRVEIVPCKPRKMEASPSSNMNYLQKWEEMEKARADPRINKRLKNLEEFFNMVNTNLDYVKEKKETIKRKEEEDNLKLVIDNETGREKIHYINYDLVEERAPNYSMRKKLEIRPRDILGNNKFENPELLKRVPLPNYNFVKTTNPEYSIPHEERFTSNVDINIPTTHLFTKGKYALDDRSDFNVKERYSFHDKRDDLFMGDRCSPGPGKYMFKGFVEELYDKNNRVKREQYVPPKRDEKVLAKSRSVANVV